MLDKTKISNVEVKKDNNRVIVTLSMPPHKKGDKVVRIENKAVIDYLLKEHKISVSKTLVGSIVHIDYSGKSADYVAKGIWIFETASKPKTKKKSVKRRNMPVAVLSPLETKPKSEVKDEKKES